MSPSPPRRAVWLPLLVTAAFALSSPAATAKPRRLPRTADQAARAEANVDLLLGWLLANERAGEGEMFGLPFPAVVRAATGRRVLAFDPQHPTDAAVLAKLTPAMDAVLVRLNAPDSPARDVKRINEASQFFEEAMRAAFTALPGLTCEFAPNAAGAVQRSGYPDLRVTDGGSGRVYYLDPKLYARGSRASSFRSFYFEPRVGTNKITADACHLIVGIEHNGRGGDEARFERWEFLDCSTLKVKLKAEFQASNRDVYRDDAVVARGGGEGGGGDGGR